LTNEKQIIEAALARCGLAGDTLKECARAVYDIKRYLPDLLNKSDDVKYGKRGFGKMELFVSGGKYERSWSDYSNPRPPEEW
jgi:hypothetical protein